MGLSNISPVTVGAWVSVAKGSGVRCSINPSDGCVVVSFLGDDNFELNIDEEVFEQCATNFPEVLRNLKAAKAAEKPTTA